MRRAAKVDDNHAEIVAALRTMGASVLDLSRVGKGCGDILVGAYGSTVFCEIKDGSKPPSARKLTPDQEKFHAAWRGGPIVILTGLSDCAVLIREMRLRALALAGMAEIPIEGDVR